MMQRRTLLQMLGLVALAPMIPTIPVAAAKPTPMAALAAEFQDPLYIVAYTRGPQGERYHIFAAPHVERDDRAGDAGQ